MLAGPVLADDRRNDRDERREWRDDRRDAKAGRRDDRRDDRREWRDDQRDAKADRHNYRRDDNRNWYKDQRQWRSVARNDWRWSGPRYRESRYVYPRGFAYQPWGVGYRLPQAYFGRPYWVSNPYAYRLPQAYRGSRWVRVGPDALMIRIGDGFVLEAVRGLWW